MLINQPPVNIQNDINIELQNIDKKEEKEPMINESNSKDIKIQKVKPLFPKMNSELKRFNDMIRIYKFVIIEIVLILIKEIGGCFFIYKILESKEKKSFTIFFIFLNIYNFFFIIFKLFQIKKAREQVKENYYHFQILINIGNIFFNFGVIFYLEKEIPIINILYFILPLLLFCILSIFAGRNYRLFKNKLCITYLPITLQNILLIFILDSKSYFFKYPLYIIQIWLSIFSSSILCFVITIWLYSLFFQRVNLNFNQKLFFSAGSGILFYFSWVGFLKYQFFQSFIKLIDNGIFSKNLNPKIITTDLQLICKNYIILGLVTILIIIIGSFFLLNLKKVEDYVSLATFTDDFNLKIKKVSDNYFVKNNNYENLEKQKNDENENLCYICFNDQDEIYLKPCGHIGGCKTCFLEYVKKKLECPFCRKKIEYAYVIRYDEEEASYYTREKIIL